MYFQNGDYFVSRTSIAGENECKPQILLLNSSKGSEVCILDLRLFKTDNKIDYLVTKVITFVFLLCSLQPVKFRPGLGAVCPHCGIVTLNFSKCQRCLKQLPDNVKIVEVKNSKLQLQSNAANQTFGMILKSQLVLPSEVSFQYIINMVIKEYFRFVSHCLACHVVCVGR